MLLELKMAPSYQGDTVVGFFYEEPTVKVGDTVQLKYRNKTLGPLKVRARRKTSLGELDYKDLVGSMYGTRQVFWSRLESLLKTGLPAEFPLWLVTFGPEFTQDPDFEAIEEEAYEEPPVIKTKVRKPKAER